MEFGVVAPELEYVGTYDARLAPMLATGLLGPMTSRPARSIASTAAREAVPRANRTSLSSGLARSPTYHS